jgi:hypothetical protein
MLIRQDFQLTCSDPAPSRRDGAEQAASRREAQTGFLRTHRRRAFSLSIAQGSPLKDSETADGNDDFIMMKISRKLTDSRE